MNDDERRRLQSHELHSARSTAAVIAALLVTAVCLYFMFEAAMKSLGQDVWIRSPGQWGTWLTGLPDSADPLVLAAGSLVVLALGLFFLLHGILPGRRARHAIPHERAIVVVDDGVLASTLARRARMQAGVTPEQVVVIVSRSHVSVQLRPTSGIGIDAAAVHAAVEDEIRTNRIEPAPDVKVQVAETGVVGQ
ncbi:DUF6286 domain-containing protein [Arthrobacter sp. JSM 101049]|uniref:DUF6286 domain-containing protein n=1 Tax=Arthrobacter sp. JSM 101049 TaxID=929097 RepID=UPI0035669A44